MKTLKLTLAISAIAFIAFSGWGNAQTSHTIFTWSADGSTDPCLGRPISGGVTYKISYHLDPNTGALENVHWIILHSDVWDTQTGDKYVVSEVGHDNVGWYWDWPGVPPAIDYPDEGVMIEAHLKWVSKGGYKFTHIERFILHRNNAGDISVVKYTFSEECK